MKATLKAPLTPPLPSQEARCQIRRVIFVSSEFSNWKVYFYVPPYKRIGSTLHMITSIATIQASLKQCCVELLCLASLDAHSEEHCWHLEVVYDDDGGSCVRKMMERKGEEEEK